MKKMRTVVMNLAMMEFGDDEFDDVELDAEEETVEELAEGDDEEEKQNESKTFTKKQLMESFLKKNANLALNKVLTENRVICEECMGGGCASCSAPTRDELINGLEVNRLTSLEDPMEENLTEEEEFDTFDDWRGSSYYNDPESRWDINRGGYDDTNKHYFDRHREKYGPFKN